LPLLLFLFLPLLDLFQPHNKRHLDRRRRTLPPQWRDPCVSSLLLPLFLLPPVLLSAKAKLLTHFVSNAVEGPAVAVAIVLALAIVYAIVSFTSSF